MSLSDRCYAGMNQGITHGSKGGSSQELAINPADSQFPRVSTKDDRIFTIGRQKPTLVPVTNPGCPEMLISASPLADVFPAVALSTLALSAFSLDFGEVKISKRRQLFFTVRNIGQEVQHVNLSTITPFRIRSENSFSLKPGRSRTVTVQFAPPIVSGFIGLVEVNGTDDKSTITLTGSGAT